MAEVHQAVRVKGEGKLGGLVGVVLEKKSSGAVLVHVSGVRDGEPVDSVVWLKASAVEVANGGM